MATPHDLANVAAPTEGTPPTSKGGQADSHPQQENLGALLIWLGLMVLLAVLILFEPLLLLFR